MTLDSLDEQLKDIILINGGDIDIAEHPHLLREAQELGLSQSELAKRIKKVYDDIDWRPYHRMDKRLVEIELKGSITESEAEAIIKEAGDELKEKQAANYIVASIKRRGFEPRETKSPEHDSFKNMWMTEAAWQTFQREKIAIEWMGEKAYSLTDIADISYRNPQGARQYFRNTNYLVPVVMTLTKSSFQANEFSKIIEVEPDLDKRFYKLLYTLNPQLPFQLGKDEVKNVHQLLEKTDEYYEFFSLAYKHFSEGYIPIWLQITDAATAQKLPSAYNINGFLNFIYQINPAHSFYLNTLRFSTPELFAKYVEENAGSWQYAAEAIANEQIQTWFAGINHYEWIKQYNDTFSVFADSPYHTAHDKEMAAVQTLLQVIDQGLLSPQIIAEPAGIKMLSVESSNQVQYPVQIKLANTGFVKVQLRLSDTIAGIHLSEQELVFHSQNNIVSGKFFIYVDGMALVKNKLYSLFIIAETAYQQVQVPVEIKVVFPKKSYTKLLLKYGAVGAVLFGGIRFLLGISISYHGWLFNLFSGQYLSLYTLESYLPPNYFYFIITLVVLLVCLFVSFPIIKKAEKL